MGGGKGGQTIGYKYFMSIHMGIGRGPLNEVVDMTAGGLSMWKDFGKDPICIGNSGKFVNIDAPELFGGEQKEGGIQGPAYFYNGSRDQVLDPPGSLIGLPSIQSSLGGDVPNFRGVTTVWFDGMVCAMNPYPKEWAFRIRRTTAGWYDDICWYPAKATIVMEGYNGELIYGMNAAHMLYEVNTNPEWGRGMPAELIDENSFTQAANQLCSEGFGLCLPWFRRESIKDFIPIVINHVGGAMYIDRETGKLTFRLIRGDYDAGALPIFGPDSGLLRVEDDDSSSEETAFNEISITGFDPVTKQDISLSVHNLASIQSVGEIISNAMEFKGLATHDLVARVAARELKAQSTGQRRFTLYLDRRGWRIKPAMPIKISWPDKGIVSMIVRVGEITDNGKEIQVKVVEDIFGLSDTTYLDPQPPVWDPPNRIPEPVSDARIFEVNWRDLYLRASESQRNAIEEGDSVVGVVAAPPEAVLTASFDLATRTSTELYEVRGQGSYTARTTLAEPLTPLATSATFDPDSMAAFMTEFSLGMVAMVGEEQIAIMLLDPVTGEAVIKRGVADTIPSSHNADDPVWLVDEDISSDYREYAAGETVFAKPLPRTSVAVLPLADAADLEIVVDQRVFRPYPPGDVKVDGQSIYALSGLYPEPVLTWAHRDRIIQADQVVGHAEGSVGPEAGVTYKVTVFAEDGVTILSEHDGIAGDTWTYDAALQAADANPEIVIMEMISQRAGMDPEIPVDSFFAYRFTVVILTDYLTIDGDVVRIDGEGIEL